MKKYTYYFADDTKNTITVEEKWYDLLKEMDEAERKQKYNYERHNYPLSQVDYEGETFADYSADPFEKMEIMTELRRLFEDESNNVDAANLKFVVTVEAVSK